MNISLIGMSCVGKTYWAKRIEKEGYTHFSCDDLIEKILYSELGSKGYSGLSDVAKWMGYPYDARYKETSQKYLQAEESAMKKILDTIERHQADPDANFVIDTTGSVIYLSNSILARLKKLSEVVYLEVSEKYQNIMISNFIRNPKPVIWGDLFSIQNNEDPFHALKQSYPDLLVYRSKRYEALADVIFRYEEHKSQTMQARDFIHQVSIA